MNKKYLFLLILIGIFLLSLPAMFPLFHKGFFVTDDGDWMIIRFSAFYQALHDGQFPVRFLHRLNFDYGYPVATFLYPGFMYVGVLIHLFKIGFVDTIKIILGLSLVGTTTFIYFWLAKVFNKKFPAILGAFVSLYFPYHLYDVYTRGSVGEIFALLWVPFCLWMIEKKNSFFISLGIFLLIISHNTMALLFIPILFIYALLRNIFSIKHLLLSFISGVLLSSFFILPIIFELPLTVFSQIVISNPLHYFADFSLIGLATIVISFGALGIFLVKNRHVKTSKNITLFFLIVSFAAIFGSSSLSNFFWQIIPSSFIQFPFRLLSYLVISLSFLTAFITAELHPKFKQLVAGAIILILAIVSSYNYLFPKTYVDKGDGYYATNDATTTVQDEYMPVGIAQKPTQRPEAKVEIESVGKSSISHLFYNNKVITFDVHLQRDSNVLINTLYWPGWKVFVDNEEDAIAYDNPKGIIRFNLANGNHKIRVEFGETTLRLFADYLSIVTFGGLCFMTFRKRKV